jgi:hypothetical protein
MLGEARTDGGDPGVVVRALAERKLLIPDGGDGKPQSRHRLPTSGTVRCYRIESSILDAGERDA